MQNKNKKITCPQNIISREEEQVWRGGATEKPLLSLIEKKLRGNAQLQGGDLHRNFTSDLQKLAESPHAHETGRFCNTQELLKRDPGRAFSCLIARSFFRQKTGTLRPGGSSV